ncbi:MAG: pilus assembly protein [Mesorhizobium sp.]|nr:pilus assembly protein [Mesorhizobium sp.]
MEFAALALPFALLVFAILESCVSFAAQEVMANATDNVARQLRTGQVLTADANETKIKQMICDELQIIVAQNCPGLSVDLRMVNTFQQAAQLGFRIDGSRIVLTNAGIDDNTVVQVGPSMSKNVLRVFYKWPVMTDFMAKAMSNMSDGTTLHFAMAIWQNEPF